MAFGLLRNLASFAASAAGFDDEVDFGFVDETPESADVMSPQPPLPASAANSWSMLVALGIALSTCGVGITGTDRNRQRVRQSDGIFRRNPESLILGGSLPHRVASPGVDCPGTT